MRFKKKVISFFLFFFITFMSCAATNSRTLPPPPPLLLLLLLLLLFLLRRAFGAVGKNGDAIAVLQEYKKKRKVANHDLLFPAVVMESEREVQLGGGGTGRVYYTT
jgi:MYXO-CTERM domain-containing protein